MIKRTSKSTSFAALILTGAVGVLVSCATMAQTTEQKVALTGGSEVPAVATTATGTATVDIKPDRSVKVLVVVTGMTAPIARRAARCRIMVAKDRRPGPERSLGKLRRYSVSPA